MNARETEIPLPHTCLAARQWVGQGSGRKGIALHGWLDNAASFDRLMPHLHAHGTWLALDLPGHGRSQHRPSGCHYHLLEYLGEIMQTADYLGWQRFSLMGHSLGAAVASLLAAAAPERIDALVLLDGLGPLAGEEEHALTQLQQAVAEHTALRDKSLRRFESVAQAVQARCRSGDLSPAAAQLLVARGLRPYEGGYVWSSDPRLTIKSLSRLTEAQIQNCLRGIQCPTLLVLADPSPPFFSEGLMAQRTKCVAGIQSHRVAGTHHFHLEEPEKVAPLITDFLARAPIVPALP